MLRTGERHPGRRASESCGLGGERRTLSTSRNLTNRKQSSGRRRERTAGSAVLRPRRLEGSERTSPPAYDATRGQAEEQGRGADETSPYVATHVKLASNTCS